MTLPERFGAYELVAPVARGGMAEVFLARRVDGEGPSPLCVKRILPAFLKDVDFTTMFRDEANLAARLVHPNIVRVHETGEVDGRLYIAMEFVNGLTLRQLGDLVRRRAESFLVEDAVAITIELCRALHYAHRLAVDGKPQDIVHRDVSPANVLVSADGRVLLMDFGIARAADRMTRTLPGLTKGKCPYMSPEQATAEAVDHRSDQFAAAILLWELLCGVPLFDEPSGAALVLEKVATMKAPPPSAARDDVSSELDRVVLRALEKKPAKRFDDMGAFERALLAAVPALDWDAYRARLQDLVQEALDDPYAPTVEIDGRQHRWSSVRESAVDGDLADPTIPEVPAFVGGASSAEPPALELARGNDAPRDVTLPQQPVPPRPRSAVRPMVEEPASRAPVAAAAGVALAVIALAAVLLLVLGRDDPEPEPELAAAVAGRCGVPLRPEKEVVTTKLVWDAEDLARAGDAKQSAALARQAIATGATPAAWLVLARALEELGDRPGALKAYSCPEELAPGSAESRLAKAATARLLGTDRLPPPVQTVPSTDDPLPTEEIVEPEPGVLPPMRPARRLTATERKRLQKLERRVAPLLLAGKSSQAIQLLDEIVALSPNNAKAYRNLAMAWRTQGDEARGAAYQTRAEQLAPSSTPTIELDGARNDATLDEDIPAEVSSGDPAPVDMPFGGGAAEGG